MSISINGRDVQGQHPMRRYGLPKEYAKTATVLAVQAHEDGLVMTPEGAMMFEQGDYILTDNPPTHAWPVRREVFESTYAPVEVLEDTDILSR